MRTYYYAFSLFLLILPSTPAQIPLNARPLTTASPAPLAENAPLSSPLPPPLPPTNLFPDGFCPYLLYNPTHLQAQFPVLQGPNSTHLQHVRSVIQKLNSQSRAEPIVWPWTPERGNDVEPTDADVTEVLMGMLDMWRKCFLLNHNSWTNENPRSVTAPVDLPPDIDLRTFIEPACKALFPQEGYGYTFTGPIMLCWTLDTKHDVMIRLQQVHGWHDNKGWYSQELCLSALYKAFDKCEENIHAPDYIDQPVPYRWNRPFSSIAVNDTTTLLELFLYDNIKMDS